MKIEGWSHPERNLGLLAVYARVSRKLTDELAALPFVRHVFYVHDMDLYAVVLHPRILAREAAEWIAGQFMYQFSIVYCGDRLSCEELQGACMRLHQFGEVIFYEKPGLIWEASALFLMMRQMKTRVNTNKRIQDQRQEELIRSIKGGREDEARALLSDCKKELYKLNVRECRREAYELYRTVNNRLVMSDVRLMAYMEPWEKRTISLWPELFYFEQVEACLDGFLNQLLAWYRLQREDPGYHAVAWVKQYLAGHYAGVCSVEEMAEGIQLPPAYLLSLFRSVTGMTIPEYVTQYRLDQACTLLHNRALRIREVSILVGYENISNFGQVFVRRYGLTPNEYRKRVTAADTQNETWGNGRNL